MMMMMMMMTMMMIITMMMIYSAVWLTKEKHLALLPVGTIASDPHHHESSTRREQGLNFRRT